MGTIQEALFIAVLRGKVKVLVDKRAEGKGDYVQITSDNFDFGPCVICATTVEIRDDRKPRRRPRRTKG